MEESWKTLEHWYRATAGVTPGAVPAAVLDALAADLNTAKTIAELHALEKSGDVSGLAAALALMGFDRGRAAELTTAPA
ncbi:hypothetical protein, partial [Acinetobacter baumannii]|uniref:hypothetical protein n=1 Tax=Acinetobacter baumannii TaxID=470 RepID=UPI001C09A4A7